MELDYKVRVALLLLAAAGGSMVLSQMRTTHGMLLSAKQASALRQFVREAGKRGRSKIVALTDEGWEAIAAEHTRPLPPRSGDGARAVLALLGGLAATGANLRPLLEREFVPPPVPEPKPKPEGGRKPRAKKGATLEARIRDAYTRLAGAPRDWVELRDMRAALPDVEKRDFDRVINDLRKAKHLMLTLHDGRGKLTPADHEAAIRVGPDDMHLMSMN